MKPKKTSQTPAIKKVVEETFEKKRKKLSDEERKIRARAVTQKYRENNREKVNETSRQWRANNKEKLRHNQKIYYMKNKERLNQYSREYYHANTDYFKEYYENRLKINSLNNRVI